jgi:tRNA(Ile)-lysidine synthase
LVLNKKQHETLNQHWAQLLQTVPDARSITVGFSGGVDSTFLLLAIHQTLPSSIDLKAIHFNHNVSKHSQAWQKHCESICQQRGIPLQTVSLQFDSLKNFESEARDRRLNHIQGSMAPDEIYAMGHHINDQVETFFMKLFRGAGLAGLSGMRSLSKFKHFYMWRPLLSLDKNDLRQTLVEQNIDWIEDESNASTDYYRNQLRLKTLPPIYQEVPHLASRIQATTQVIQANLNVLNDYLDKDLNTFSKSNNCLNTSEIRLRGASHVSLMINRFLEGLDIGSSYSQISNLTDAVLDKKYLEVWLKQKVIVVENDLVIIFDKLEPTDYCVELNMLNKDIEFYQWNLPSGLGYVYARKCQYSKERKSWISLSQLDSCQLIPRPFGQVVHPEGRNHSLSLKKFLQERKVPKYVRKLLPVVVCRTSKNIICVPSVFTNKLEKDEQLGFGFELTWSNLEII